jgi:hypothetical protein
MKNIISIAAIAAASFSFAPQVLASEGGSCHFHGSKPSKESVVVGCATKQKDALIKKGRLEATWQAVPLDKAEQVDGKSAKEWKLTFKNPAATDKTKDTLTMFFTLPGNFIAANFTGK